jgi:3,4-dihydroxy 2-butanone 4-phosphate synthase / GTP cyclohydrolase II
LASLRSRIEQLFSSRRRDGVRRVATAHLPTEYANFQIYVYESAGETETHVALVHGPVGDGEAVLARMHSSCLTGDVLHSVRCDCGATCCTRSAATAARSSIERCSGLPKKGAASSFI